MRIRSIRAALGAALALLVAPGAALALPGQTTAQFLGWAKANGALTGLKKATNEMSGEPYYQARFKAGALNGNFVATLGDDGSVISESLGYDAAPDDYDILKHPEVVRSLVQTVYGGAVAGDVKDASQVGRWTLKDETSATALYKGELYGYEIAHAFVKILPLKAVATEAAELKRCATQECGD